MNTLITVAIAWLVLAGLGQIVVRTVLARGPNGDPLDGLVWWTIRIYVRVMHLARYRGIQHVPPTNQTGGLIVVSNHTCGIDPLLIQARCRFLVQWLMASEMMAESLGPVWKRYGIIPVKRDGQDSGPAREAIRVVRAGGTIGVFPEGGIASPPGEVRPFLDGVGLIAARARVPILLVWISGTPDIGDGPAWSALWHPSRARIEFIDQIEFPKGTKAAEIARSLRERLAQASGWPLNDEPLPTSALAQKPAESATMPA